MMSMQAQLALWVLYGVGAAALIVMFGCDLEGFFRRIGAPQLPWPALEPDSALLEAMREVDALYPHTPPIAPPAPLDLTKLRVPDAGACEVDPGQSATPQAWQRPIPGPGRTRIG